LTLPSSKSRTNGICGSLALTSTVAAVVIIGVVLPFSPLARPLGFTAPPIPFIIFVAGAVVTYLCLVEVVKQVFFRFHPLAGPVERRNRPITTLPARR
jgi:Mg2+-importing ATPase